MSKKDIRKSFKGSYFAGKWLKRYFEKRTTKTKHKDLVDGISIKEEIENKLNIEV